MKLERCENGHFYDIERFDECPHCNQTSISTVLEDENGEKGYTLPVENETPNGLDQLKEEITGAKENEEVETYTVGYYGKIEPVVGWLVAIEGSNYGQAFTLKSGKNFVGRSFDMDVSLSSDPSISRNKHAIILYEPKSNKFLVQPGESKELYYLNEEVVLSATEIKAYDILTLGSTKLLFIPCCSEKFTWDSTKTEE